MMIVVIRRRVVRKRCERYERGRSILNTAERGVRRYESQGKVRAMRDNDVREDDGGVRVCIRVMRTR